MTATGSQAVDRACALLAEIVQSPTPVSFTSLVDDLGLARSTTSRLLAALERNRLVHRDAEGTFHPGPLFALYAAEHDANAALTALAAPHLHRIAQATGETINLAVARAGGLVHIAQEDSRFLLGASNWVGVDVPAHCTALGKVLYAWGVLPLPADPLERPAANSPASVASIEAELSSIRRRGWALADEELEPGLAALAAPVLVGGRAIAAISITWATARRATNTLEPFTRILLEESAALGRLLSPTTERNRSTSAA